MGEMRQGLKQGKGKYTWPTGEVCSTVTYRMWSIVLAREQEMDA